MAGAIATILRTLGVLLLLAAAFDVTKIDDNMMIFAAIACFIVACAIKRIAKNGGGSCCK